MKKRYAVLLIIAACLLLGQAEAFQNEPEGFRRLKWGIPPHAGFGLQYALDSDGMRIYRILNDKMWLGDVSLTSIFYGFWNSKFVSVCLYFDGKENYDLLKTICESKFGEGIVLEFYGMSWLGNTTIVVLTYDMIEDDGFLGMSGTVLYLEYMEARGKQLAEKAESDW